MSQPPASAPRPAMNLRGAVDLSALVKKPPPGPGAGPAAGPGARPPAAAPAGAVVVDVTAAMFESVIAQSMTVPVVVDLWATWCEPCKQLSPILERLAAEYGGRFLLAKVDVDENQQIAQAFQVQSIPSVVAIVKGQPLPLFQGAVPEEQVRGWLDELLRVAGEAGVNGRIAVAGEDAVAAEPVEPPLPPLHAEAYDAIERDDLAAASDAYRRALVENPSDGLATAGLAQVELMRRTAGADVVAARAAAADLDDVEAQLLVADLDVMGDHVDEAFGRLVDLVRRTAGDERERVRVRLVELFEIVGLDDDRVHRARRALASALF